MHTTTRLMLLVAALLISQPLLAKVTATVDRTEISEFDVLKLTVRVTGRQDVNNPDFTALETDFEILSQQSRQQSAISFINGQQTTTVSRDFILSLRARRLGQLTIPRMEVDGEWTQPIAIRAVQQSAATRRKMSEVVYFESEVDTNETYVQGQVVYTLRLFYADTISGDFPPPPDIDNAVVETIETERRFEQIVDNRRYFVLEKQYAIFPQQSGVLTIPRETFVGTRGRGGLFSARQRVNAISRRHDIRVLPRPAAFDGDTWLPASSVTISETWSDNGPYRVGEPVNRTINLVATGVTAAQVPLLPALEHDNLKTYTDPPETEEYVDPAGAGIVAASKITVGIVPVESGTVTLPEIRVPWWNTRTNQQEHAVIPARTLVVRAAASAQVLPPAPVGTPTEVPAPIVSVQVPAWTWPLIAGLALAWAITALLLFQTRRRLVAMATANETGAPVSSPSQDEARAFRNLEQACKQHDAQAALSALGLWVRTLPGGSHCASELARQDPKGELETALRELETQVYGNGSSAQWQGHTLLGAASALRRTRASPKSPDRALVSTLNPG